MSKETGPQHDEFLTPFDPNNLLATSADIARYSADNTQYPLEEYSCTDLNLHCRGCIYKKVCIVWKK